MLARTLLIICLAATNSLAQRAPSRPDASSARADPRASAWIVVFPNMGNACGEACDYQAGWRGYLDLKVILTHRYPKAQWDIEGDKGFLYIGPFSTCSDAQATLKEVRAVVEMSLSVNCLEVSQPRIPRP